VLGASLGGSRFASHSARAALLLDVGGHTNTVPPPEPVAAEWEAIRLIFDFVFALFFFEAFSLLHIENCPCPSLPPPHPVR